MKTDIFDIEEQIMSVWQTSEDLQLMIDYLYENEDNIDKDKFWNLATGIKALNEIRMNKLFTVYENFAHDYFREKTLS